MIGQSSLTLLILSKRIEKLRTISIKYHCRLNILWQSILHFPFNGTLFSKFSPMSFVGPWAAKREVMVMTSRLFSAAAGEVTPSFSLSRRFTAPLFSRDGSSLFFLDRVEPEPIFFGSGRAWATDFVSRAYVSQKKFCLSLLRASKIPMKVEIC